MTAYLDASVLLPTTVVEAASGAVDTFLLTTSDDLPIGDFSGTMVASAIPGFYRQNAWPRQIAPTDARLAGLFVRRLAKAARALGLPVEVPGT